MKICVIKSNFDNGSRDQFTDETDNSENKEEDQMKALRQTDLRSPAEEERRKHTTLETGIYVDDELIIFERITLPGTRVQILLPEYFMPMQETVRNVKYPSRYSPGLYCHEPGLHGQLRLYNVLPVRLDEGGTE